MKKLEIEFIAPTAWKDFLRFCEGVISKESFLKENDFLLLPFEMQLGMYLKYFNENGLEWDIQNVAIGEWPSVILDVFKTQDKIMGHFS